MSDDPIPGGPVSAEFKADLAALNITFDDVPVTELWSY